MNDWTQNSHSNLLSANKGLQVYVCSGERPGILGNYDLIIWSTEDNIVLHMQLKLLQTMPKYLK